MEFREIESAFQRRVQTFSQSFGRQQYVSLDQVFPLIRAGTQALLYRQLQLKYLIRFSLVSYVQYRKEDELGHVVDTIIFPLHSTSRNVYMAHGRNDIGRMVRAAENELIQRNEQLLGVGSDWMVDFVSAQNVEV